MTTAARRAAQYLSLGWHNIFQEDSIVFDNRTTEK
jgi:hypothetical protein